jgi:hypothetical protein
MRREHLGANGDDLSEHLGLMVARAGVNSCDDRVSAENLRQFVRQ